LKDPIFRVNSINPSIRRKLSSTVSSGCVLSGRQKPTPPSSRLSIRPLDPQAYRATLPYGNAARLRHAGNHAAGISEPGAVSEEKRSRNEGLRLFAFSFSGCPVPATY